MEMIKNFGIAEVNNTNNEVSYVFVSLNTYSEIPSNFSKKIIFEHNDSLTVVNEFKKYNNPTNVLKY